MCRFSELTDCKFRREVTLDETYDCQLLLSKITRTGIEFEIECNLLFVEVQFPW